MTISAKLFLILTISFKEDASSFLNTYIHVLKVNWPCPMAAMFLTENHQQSLSNSLKLIWIQIVCKVY